nr:hypothetical protein CFP56_18518 [Quercus suber]
MLPSLAGGMLQDFINAQDLVLVPTVTSSTNRWCPSNTQYYKANFDGAVFKSSNIAGLRVVIRDSHGDIMGPMLVRVLLPQSVIEVEALACRHAVSFIVDLGLHEVIFEGDLGVLI